MQDYLKPNVSTIDESKFTFAARSRMLELRSNYKGQYIDSDILCPLCGKEEDNQPHLLVCEELQEQGALVVPKSLVSYEKHLLLSLNLFIVSPRIF